MSWQPTDSERAAYAHMQARLIELLLRHDERVFRRYVAPQVEGSETDHETLRRYRDLGVFFHLADELFEHILPRIVRRLSFESPRVMSVEEPPARGRVDWERTLAATWQERPGETPLQLHTRERRRDFAIPENLLTVVTLLEYRDDVQRLLWGDREAIGAEPLRHPLNDIVERCEREMAFPQFAGLREEAQAIIEGAQGGPEALEARVLERLIPGGNSAYEELLDWRARRRDLRLLRRDIAESDDVLGADPRRDNYLYQLWIFYEMADMLQEQEQLITLDTEPGQMRLEFLWGKGDQVRRYEIRHDQSVTGPVAAWAAVKSLRAPGVRPDFYLRRLAPAMEQVIRCHGGGADELIWREPGVVWDAKYYRERDSEGVPSGPVKRMLADLLLLGEELGVLLFAFLREESAGAPASETDNNATPVHGYHLRPQKGYDQTLVPRQDVLAFEMRPELEVVSKSVRKTLIELLDKAHRQLRHPRVPQCYGVFVDSLTIGRDEILKDRYGKAFKANLQDVLICPKPHIGAWRIDLVSRELHCCRNPEFCHIIGRPGSRPPSRPPRDIKDLVHELELLAQDPGQLDDEAVAEFERQVKAVSRRYAELAKFEDQLDRYRRRARQVGLYEAFERLDPDQQGTVALALFLAERLDEVGAKDYTAPTIHLAGVLEHAVRQRIFQCPGLSQVMQKPTKQTLGALTGMRRDYQSNNITSETRDDWPIVQAYAEAHWKPDIDAGTPATGMDFDTFVTELGDLSNRRNDAAHGRGVTPMAYETQVHRAIFQQGNHLRIGLLRAILLAWRP